jgi:hypothetical protein
VLGVKIVKKWLDAHTVNVDWYVCSVARTQPLNGNRKANTAQRLWAQLGGWTGCEVDAEGAGEVDGKDPAAKKGGSGGVCYVSFVEAFEL